MNFLRSLLIVCLFLVVSLRITAQYIHEVMEYLPAPGQHINGPAGSPPAAQSIIGTTTGLVSLGAFGGSITFRFENPVANNPDHPFGIDFTIFGNSVGQWSEPGIVSVMKDINKNGIADDTWFELAGSEYHSDETAHNYTITYHNPGGSGAADVPWEDNLGNAGFVYANASHSQSYYPNQELFPNIENATFSLTGTRIYATIDSSTSMLVNSPTLDYGYADNHVRGASPYTVPDNPVTPETEGAGGDPMDISWAVDQNGNNVNLDTIHFIKVHTAVNGHAGILGEISTEISGAAIVGLPLSENLKKQNRSEKEEFKIYPNPVGNILSVDGEEKARIKLFSMTGKLLLEWDYNGALTSLDISTISQGMYLIQICNEETIFTESLIKR